MRWHSETVQRELEELYSSGPLGHRQSPSIESQSPSIDILQPAFPCFEKVDDDEPVEVMVFKPEKIIKIEETMAVKDTLNYDSCSPSSSNVVQPEYADFVPHADDPKFDLVKYIQLDFNSNKLAWQDPDYQGDARWKSQSFTLNSFDEFY